MDGLVSLQIKTFGGNFPPTKTEDRDQIHSAASNNQNSRGEFFCDIYLYHKSF